MTLEKLLAEREAVQQRLSFVNVRCGARDRMERELSYLNAIVAQMAAEGV